MWSWRVGFAPKKTMTTNSNDQDSAPGIGAGEQERWVSAPRAAARASRARARALRAREDALVRAWLKALDALERAESTRVARRDKAKRAVAAAMWPYTPTTYGRVTSHTATDWRRRSRVDPHELAKVQARVTAATKRHEAVLRRLDAEHTTAQNDAAAATAALLAALPHLGQVLGLSGRALAELTRTRTGA